MKALVLVQMTVLALLLGSAALQAQGGKRKPKDKGVKVTILKADRVYYPRRARSKTYKKPALISCARVLNATPEYKEIARKKIKPGSAAYDILVKKASDRCKRAINKAVSQGGYDLIAETGAVTAAGKSLPDVTATVITKLAAR